MDELVILYINIGIIIVVSGFVNYYLSRWISKSNKWLVFIIPGVLFLISLGLLFIGLTMDQGVGFGALGIIILFAFTMVVFISTFVSSLIVFMRHKF